MLNVFYLLDCHVCVGESVQPFNKRMNGHRSDLAKKTLLPVSQHFVSPVHSLTTILVGKRIKDIKERVLGSELQTLHPEGINKKA